MYCYKCGLKINEQALECEHCGANVAHVMIPRFYKAAVFFGICMLMPALASVAVFFAGLVGMLDSYVLYIFIIFGAVGLPLALKSRRRFAVILNIAGIVFWLLLVLTPHFAVDSVHNDRYQDRAAVSEALESFIK
ncbi:MAG: hypothetical protein FWE74_02165 [Oscillospiraceae bacterium]|nr:hypothetical protein [Oscillospiraceae bacterium]